MAYEQLSMFNDDVEESTGTTQATKESSRVSESIINSFAISSLPFIGCDFDMVYPQIASILPEEKTNYSFFPLEVAIRCEIVCAGICHQMNWDFLRDLVNKKTRENQNWLSGLYLKSISSEEVAEMFNLYSKPERIRADERTEFLHSLGKWLDGFENATRIFTTKDGSILNKTEIRNNILSCDVFSNDPEEKKLQLLLQKLSMYTMLNALKNYCEPAIDYHLIRCYLRRGLLYPKRKQGNDYISNEKSTRKESTVAAIRQLCSELLIDISDYTDLDILTVNQIEWNIGRSVCIQDNPDCYLQNNDANWLKTSFSSCPFLNTCCARHYNDELLKINEPTYLGDSY